MSMASTGATVVATRVRIAQAHQPDIVATIRMKGVFIVPPDRLFAADTDLLVCVLFDGQHFVNDVAVLLRHPTERFTKQRRAKDEEYLLFKRARHVGFVVPMARRRADFGLVDGVTGDQADSGRRLKQFEFGKETSQPSRQFVREERDFEEEIWVVN